MLHESACKGCRQPKKCALQHWSSDPSWEIADVEKRAPTWAFCPAAARPWLEAEVEELAYLIDEGSADSIRHQHARAIAVELMELRRIRAARENLFLDQVKRIKPLSAARQVRACIDFYKNRPNPDIVYMLAGKAGLDTQLRPVSFEDGIGVLARNIARLDRDEARALSRRRRAIQLFHLPS